MRHPGIWRRQPRRQVELDQRYGFTHAWLPSLRSRATNYNETAEVGGIADVSHVHHGMFLTNGDGGSTSVVATTFGAALRYPLTASSYSGVAAFPITGISGTNPFTMLAVCRHNTVSGATRTLMAHRPLNGWVWFLNGTYQWYDDTNGFEDSTLTATASVPVATMVTSDGLGNFTFWENGRSATIAIGSAVSSVTGALTVLEFGGFTGLNGPLDSDVALFALGYQFTPPALAREITRNPWQIFQARPKRLHFGVTAAAPSFNAAWNAGANTLIHTGALTQ
jgi:hypothetical protein